jgi:pimeloyl-ACP methyl ester carboxylesterase
VLMASCGRSDTLRTALSAAESELLDGGVVLPQRYASVVRAMRYLSPRTLNDAGRIRDWLDIFELSPADSTVARAQRGLEVMGDRLAEYRNIKAQCLVIAFQDDLMVPPYLCREVADHIPNCKYEVVPGCGHYGYLEEPDAVNSLIISFFRESG